MNNQVIYFSKTGHTKMVAEAIASVLGVEAVEVDDASLEDGTRVFLGSGCYGGNPAKEITEFILENDFTARDVALFGTSGSGKGKELDEMEGALSGKQAKVVGRFCCKGKFLFKNRDRPNKEDLEDARKFARSLIE